MYARRFESRKTGKSGYAPACSNEWVRSVCEKPRIKCAECPNRRFLPVTDDVIRWHLSGYDPEGQPFVAGVYPLLQDETCFFLAVDFDKADWRDDADAFLKTCRRLNLEVALERSRSGRGAHAWFFFEQAIPAALARRLGSHVLTETMEGRPDVGLDSYDRLFPNEAYSPPVIQPAGNRAKRMAPTCASPPRASWDGHAISPLNAYGVRSVNPGCSDKDWSYGLSAHYPNDVINAQVVFGFVQRDNVRLFRAAFSYNPRPKNFLNVLQMNHDVFYTRFTRLDNGQLERSDLYITWLDVVHSTVFRRGPTGNRLLRFAV